MDASVREKLAAQAADRERVRAERLRDEIAAMFSRRAAKRYLWWERWDERDGYEYAEAR